MTGKGMVSRREVSRSEVKEVNGTEFNSKAKQRRRWAKNRNGIAWHSWATLRKKLALNCYGKVAKGPEQQRKRIGSLGLEQYSCGIVKNNIEKRGRSVEET